MLQFLIFLPFSYAVKPLYTHQWAVKLNSDIEASILAAENGMENLGFVVDSYYLLEAPILIEQGTQNVHESKLVKREWNGVPLSHLLPRTLKEVEDTFGALEFIEQVPRERKKRNIVIGSETDLNYFDDPLYSKQWHLYNNGDNGNIAGNDINVAPVWKQGINGSGVIVSIIDDGVDFTHQDLAASWSRDSSYDFTTRNANPAPQDKDDTHGTRCAGEIGARPNQVCGVGVAYGAGLAGERLIAESTTDAIEAQAFTFKNQINAIYSASWGPSDDGTSVDGPGTLGKRAMQQGVTNGRDGRGSIFVFASGNGGQQRDNCNFDGYANSIHTVAVGAITWSGKKPWYGEECSAHLAVVYSGGEGLSITTTDINHECTSQHSGTSAAAPLASGMIALMLSARPELGWRDIQQIIVETAQMTDETDADWVKNGAGRMVSHKYGFGKMDAEKLVNRGLKHTILPTPALTFSIKEQSKELMDYNVDDAYQSDLLISEEQANAIGLASLEHVQVTVSITHPERSHLRITLVSPSGTKSLLAAVRPKDESKSGYDPWTFMTVRNWGESAAGVWSLLVEDGRYGRKDENGAPFAAGYLSSWELILHGTCSSSDITEITKESTGRKSLTCAATVKKSEQVQRELMVGFLVFVIGTSIAFTAYAIYRYRLHRPADKYFPARDDAESPSDSSIYERIGLINMRPRADDLESPDNLKPWSNSVDSSPGSGSSPWSNAAKSPSPSYNVSLNGRPRAVPRMAESPSLSTAQNRLALLDQTRNDDEYNSDEDLQADPPQSSITNFAPIVPSNISSLKPNGGGLHRTNSASRPLNLMVADSNKSMSNLNDNPRVLTRSASSMRVLDRGISESALRKGDSLSELRKPLTRSRSGMIDPKSA